MDLLHILSSTTKAMGIELGHHQIEPFLDYYKLLIEWNQKMNLTAITEPYDVAIKHFADSISILKYADIKQDAKLIDIGTGAGFPGIPLKLVRRDINLTLLDSLNKRLVFLENVCDKLGFKAQILHSRAEEGANNPDLREKFDIATSRAVAQLNVLCEYCLPYVKIGGRFIAMKGPKATDEIEAAKNAIAVLGGKITTTNEFVLPDGSARTIVIIEKVKNTSEKYPRHGSKIKSKPL